MYNIFLDQLLLPVPPEEMKIKHNGRNDTITLINDGEVNILKTGGLKEVSFNCLLPNVRYPFAMYLDAFHPASYYLDYFKAYMENKQPFNFIVTRMFPTGKMISYTIMRCVMEDITEKESADNGFDTTAEIKIKEFKPHCTKLYSLTDDGKVVPYGSTREHKPRSGGNLSYTVQEGDTLWKIAQFFYGSGAEYDKIMNANNITKNPDHAIWPGLVLTIA